MLGLHHVRAITADSSANQNFYSQILGLHQIPDQPDLAYALAVNTSQPCFIFKHQPDAPQKVIGTDTISAVLLTVESRESLAFWQQRFQQNKIWCSEIEEVAGSHQLQVEDPDGLSIILVAKQVEDPTGPTASKTTNDSTHAIIGLHGIQLTIPTLEHLHFVFTKVFGWQTSDNVAANNQTYRSLTTYTFGQGRAGGQIQAIIDDRLQPAWQEQAGTIQELAIAVKNSSQLELWQSRLNQLGIPNTDIHHSNQIVSLSFQVSRGVRLSLVIG